MRLLNTDPYGYHYFPIRLMEKEYEILDRRKKFVLGCEINLWKVGLMLPCYWENKDQLMYCFITDDGYSLTKDLDWKLIT